MVVGKPHGLLLHKSPIDFHESRNLVDILTRQLQRDIYPVHRLDKPTSGLLIVALNPDVARELGRAFESHQVQKSYIAVARGYTELCGCIDHDIGDKDNPRKGKSPATTNYQTLARIELPIRVDRYPTTRYSLLCIKPVTGRRHQIRQHMKHINHPLIGDTSYGKTPHNRLFASVYDCRRLLLHASQLTFPHPLTNHSVTVQSAPGQPPMNDDQFARVLRDPRWQPVGKDASTYLRP